MSRLHRSSASMFLLTIALFFTTPAFAVTRTWTGATSDRWSEPSNWSPAGVPTTADALVFPSGAATKAMTNDMPSWTSLGAMTFNADYALSGNALTLMGNVTGGRLICNADVKMGGSIAVGGVTFNGTVDVNDQSLVLSGPSAINGPLNGSGVVRVSLGVSVSSGSGTFHGTFLDELRLHGAMLPDAKVGGFQNRSASLSGDGTIGLVTIEVGTVRAGTTAGTGVLHTKSLQVGNNILFGEQIGAWGNFTVDLFPGRSTDLVQVSGTVTFLPRARLIVTIPSGQPVEGQTFTIIDNDGNDPVSGTFRDLSEGATFTLGMTTLRISYAGGDGNDIVLTVVSTNKMWTGAVSGLWSDARNWMPQERPLGGEPLNFPADASTKVMINDLPWTTWAAMTIHGDYSLSGNALELLGNVTGGTLICNADVRVGGSRIGLTVTGVTFNGTVDVRDQSLSFSGPSAINGPLNGSGVIRGGNQGVSVSSGGGAFSGTFFDEVRLHGAILPDAKVGGLQNQPASLSGEGTIGQVTIAVGSLSPGTAGAGLLHTRSLQVGNNMMYGEQIGAWSNFNVELFPGGSSDQVQVGGTVTFLPRARLFVTVPSGTPVVGQSFTIIDNDGSDPVNGTFHNLLEGATIAAGPYTFRISYVGGSGNDVILTVLSETVTTLAQSSSTTALGDSFTLTATVSSPYGAPVGTVTFLDGSTNLGASDLQNGIATLIPAPLPGGPHSLVADYRGVGIFRGSQSAALSHNVLRDRTSMVIETQRPALVYGQELLLKATVQPAARTVAAMKHVAAVAPFLPGGSVTITAGGSPIGAATLSDGIATFNGLLPAGTHSINAAYSGDANFEATSSNSIDVSVAKAQPSITLQRLNNPAPAGSTIVLDITVKAFEQPAVVADGTLTVSENNRVLAAGTLELGHASLSLQPLAAGDHHLVITYSGSSNFESSNGVLVQTVLPPVLSVASVRAAEGNDGNCIVSVAIRLSVASQQPVSVAYATVDGTAVAGQDYEPAGGTIVFGPGELTQSVALRVSGDTTPEEDETFSVVLSNPTNASVAAGTGEVVIVDDDPFYTSAFDFEYAEAGGVPLTLDLYTPTTGSGPFPLIIWVPGDQFYDGARSRATPALHEAKRGYAVAAITYRGAGTAVFPAQISDIKAAIRWLRANAARFQLDPLRFGIWGVGAGAHLASLAGLTADTSSFEDLAEGNPAVSSRVQAVVDWAGPADLLQLQSDALSCATIDYRYPGSPVSLLIGCPLLSCPENARRASPTQYVTVDDPPFLIMHGDGDCVVSVAQSQRLFNALKDTGIVVEFDLYPGMGHDGGFWYLKDTMDEVDAFFDNYLKAQIRQRPMRH